MSASSTSREQIDYDDDALKSPFTRMYFCPKSEQIISCAMGLQHPVDLEAFKKAICNSIMMKHPRFSSLMVRDQNGRECWQNTHVNIDDHIIIHHATTSESLLEDDKEVALNAFLADMAASTNLRDHSKPLWELHLLMDLNCVVLRVHHALADGFSLMSMILACSDKERDVIDEKNNTVDTDHNKKNSHAKRRNWEQKGVRGLFKSIWFTFVFGLRLVGKILWVKDSMSVISGGDGVELWPRKLATAKFKLEDLLCVKKSIPNATINDALLGVISCGISKYLDLKSSDAMLEGLQLTSIIAVNQRNEVTLQEMVALLKENPKFHLWGNKTSALLVPFNYSKELHCLEHVKEVKGIMDKKKLSYESKLIRSTTELLTTYLGPEVISQMFHRTFCNTTLLISNIEGPSEEIAINGNPITFIRVNVCSLPHALTIHMVSYAGKAYLQVMVAKDIIHDPELLVKCFQESIHSLNEDPTTRYH